MSEKPTYRDIYRDRDVNVVRELVEVLVRPPERPLTENDKKEVYAFEQTIGDKEVIEGLTIEDLFLDSSNEDAQAPQFFAAAQMRILLFYHFQLKDALEASLIPQRAHVLR
jgi:hypothetical protein